LASLLILRTTRTGWPENLTHFVLYALISSNIDRFFKLIDCYIVCIGIYSKIRIKMLQPAEALISCSRSPLAYIENSNCNNTPLKVSDKYGEVQCWSFFSKFDRPWNETRRDDVWECGMCSNESKAQRTLKHYIRC